MTKLYDMKYELYVPVADHEILLSFMDDASAKAFYAWLGEIGRDLFIEWLKDSEEWRFILE